MATTGSPRHRSSLLTMMTRPLRSSSQSYLPHSPTITSPSQTVYTSTHLPEDRKPSLTNSSSKDSLTTLDYKIRAIAVLTSLYLGTSQADAETGLISSDLSIQHDGVSLSDETMDLDTWSRRMSRLPELDFNTHEVIVDLAQRKVRVRSQLQVVDGASRRESVDVLEFNHAGLLTSLTSEWRIWRGSEEAYEDDDESEE